MIDASALKSLFLRLRAPVLGGIAAIALFAAGRWTAPQPDITQDDSVSITVQQRSATVYDRSEAKTRDVVRRVVVVAKPDGSSVRTTDEREHEASLTTERLNTTSDTASKTDAKRSLSVTSSRPQWRVGAMAGVNLQLAPQVGAIVERRILGPASVGAWVLVQPSPSFNIAGGVALTLEF
jgi:hypothetical protein